MWVFIVIMHEIVNPFCGFQMDGDLSWQDEFKNVLASAIIYLHLSF
jgi:hypothetical protein